MPVKEEVHVLAHTVERAEDIRVSAPVEPVRGPRAELD
jgi:hypothetical protein